MEHVGVFLCECGPNIKDALDLDELAGFARTLDQVVVTKCFKVFCSEEGRNLLRDTIKEHGLSRVVLAACSPKEHERTFQRVLAECGLNPFLVQVANIREQCAWVHKNRAGATEKAKATVRAAVNRVLQQEPLTVRHIDCQSDVLVVGAGVTGISAALALAQKNRQVYLVEKSPVIGGKVARYEEVFPNLECAPCMMDPKMDAVLHHDRIEPLLFSEVQEILGCYGNFVVRIRQKARSVDTQSCIGCGACCEVCPVTVRNEYSEGLDERKAVYMPYAGALPNVAVLDREHCLRFQGKPCDACQKACPFGSINYDETDRIREIKVGAAILATGFDLFDARKAPQYGYGKIDDVYTGLEFERILSSTGPTAGRILLRNGQPPGRIAFVHCVGSRSARFDEYCSGVCCRYLVKFAHLARKKLPAVSLTHIYTDFCLPGKESQMFLNKLAATEGTAFLQCRNSESIAITRTGGAISVRYRDTGGADREVAADLVVLATAMEGARDAGALAGIFDIAAGAGGFLVEEHPKLAPVSTTTEGIFIAGCAQGPRDIPDAVAAGQAAAGLILSRLIPGEQLALEPMIAAVDENLCSGCKSCISLCPYKAITYAEQEKRASVNDALCRGCGTCAAACPSGAIKARHFTDQQIFAEVEGLLK